MNAGRTVFAQRLDFLPKYEFDKCVARDHGNRRVRKLPAYEHFLGLAFAQLTGRESWRDIETGLASLGSKNARCTGAGSTSATIPVNRHTKSSMFNEFLNRTDRKSVV